MSQRSKRLVQLAKANFSAKYSEESSSSSESLDDPFHCSSDGDPTYQVDEVEAEESDSASEKSDQQISLPVAGSSNNPVVGQPSDANTLLGTFTEPIPDEVSCMKNLVNEGTENMDVDNRSEDNSNDPDVITEAYNIEWRDPVGEHEQFSFDPQNTGVNPEIAAALVGQSPIDFFSLFIDDEILQIMTDQTNLYATQKLVSTDDISEGSRLHAWTPTDKEEIKKFVGIIGYMGLVRLATMDRYWSKRKKIYQNSIVGQIMSRNRFELLLNMWHFTDNDMCPEGDRGYKIEPIMDLLIKKFQGAYIPAQEFCIDESLIPFRGRLIMKQYIPQKTHKYGVKIFKLCCGSGFTWNMKLYCGKHADGGVSVPTNIVMHLSQKLLNSGRTVVTDNYYTSLELANNLLDKKTHLLGTLRSNRRGNPKEVINKKLKRGEVVAQENNRGICILKWKDKRDVLMISTKHTHETVIVHKRTGDVEKPVAVIEYNKAKSSIDLSDQMASYHSALRKTVKWYRKIAIELIFGTAMVNAHFLYKAINDQPISITDFKESVVECLLFPDNDESNLPSTSKPDTRQDRHILKKKEGCSHKVRRYCKGCYNKKLKGEIPKNKVTKVTTYCDSCEGNPHFCLDCFGKYHK
nr:unnamed protein product [Callosobruchus chinensis]